MSEPTNSVVQHFDALPKQGPKLIFEIGVGQLSTCRTIQWINRGVKVVMFEPNPENYQQLVAAFRNKPNVEIYNVALSNFEGETELVLDGDSSYLNGIASPSAIGTPQSQTEQKKRIKVPVKTLASFDRGDIDLLLIDTEGSEFDIISKMISRPNVISVETEMHNDQVNYTNPNLEKIRGWMAENGYLFAKQDDADSWYIRKTERAKIAGMAPPSKALPPLITEDGSKHFLECLVASVGCGDVLDKTLRFNTRHFDHFIVVTTPEDAKTREVCAKHGVTCVLTDAFYHNGAKFDRAKAREVAITHLKYGQFVLLLDADILLHVNFRECLSTVRINPDRMYGAERIHVTKPIHIKLMTEGRLCGPIHANEWGFGYFQLFHMRSRFLRGKGQIFRSYPTEKEPFGLDDYWFREQFGSGHVFVDGVWNWDPEGQARVHIPCYHIGEPAGQSKMTGLISQL